MNGPLPPLGDWLALVSSLPAANTATRMRVWRGVRALGCGALRDGVWLLPAGDEARQALDRLARDIAAEGGSAHVLSVTSIDATQAARLRALFDRSEDYRALAAAIQAASAGDARTLRALRRSFEALAAIDYFPGPAQAQVRQSLAELDAALAPGEPGSAEGRIERLDRAAYRGRSWATRRHLWVDRMASAWLIRRFIDRRARFLWLARPQDCPADALGFDFDGAAFSHVGPRVTYEVLLASFALDGDAALRRIGEMVRFLDVGGIEPAAAAGIEAVLRGARARARDDDALLADASRIFDSLYASLKESP
jgi:hypothetical protein